MKTDKVRQKRQRIVGKLYTILNRIFHELITDSSSPSPSPIRKKSANGCSPATDNSRKKQQSPRKIYTHSTSITKVRSNIVVTGSSKTSSQSGKNRNKENTTGKSSNIPPNLQKTIVRANNPVPVKPKTLSQSDKHQSSEKSLTSSKTPPIKHLQKTPLSSINLNLPVPSISFTESTNSISVTEAFIEKAFASAFATAFLPIQHWMARNDTRMERLEQILTPTDPEDDLEIQIRIESVDDVTAFEQCLMNPEYRKRIVSTYTIL